MSYMLANVAGYQKLKGQDALDYVRYRHGDNDFFRAGTVSWPAGIGRYPDLDHSWRYDFASRGCPGS